MHRKTLVSRSTVALSIAMVALLAAPARAGLLSQPVEVDYLFPTIGDVNPVLGTGTVTAGGFTVNSFGQHNYTVSDTQIVLQNVHGDDISFTAADFNGYELIETGGSPAIISGFSVNAATNVTGFNSSRVTFDATHVWLNMQDLVTSAGQGVVLDLTFGTSTVPEPGSFAFVGLGAAALALMRRVFRS